jgi:hypothetical protein
MKSRLFTTTQLHFLTLLAVLGLMVVASFRVEAATAERLGATSAENQAILSAFQTKQSVVAPAIVVPTVVGVPVEPVVQTNETFLVFNEVTGEFVGSELISQRDRVDQVNRAETTPFQVIDAHLVDNDRQTTVDFPVGETEINTVVITLQNASGALITADRLEIGLAPHVSLPVTVTIRSSRGGILNTVVAPRELNSTTVRFPETTADFFVIEFSYVQPLRIAELDLHNGQLFSAPTHQLRFLAQPNTSYSIFSNPDRSVSLPRLESGNLRSDEDILELPPTDSFRNASYIPADIDEDGIRDLLDNCVAVANVDQLDIDGNGKGDACEDFDRDGHLNPVDNCPDLPNRNQADEDADGIGDVCDDEESRFTERYVWVPWIGMGLAVVVIVALFAIVGFKPEPTEVKEEDEPAPEAEGEPPTETEN